MGSNFKLQNSKNFGNFDLNLEKTEARQFGENFLTHTEVISNALCSVHCYLCSHSIYVFQTVFVVYYSLL